MKVADLMTRHVEFVDGEAPVKEAAELMGEIDVGVLPVGSADRLEGILTDRDVLYRVVARAARPDHGQGARGRVPACDRLRRGRRGRGSDGPDGAPHHVRRLPVRDASGQVVGWVTLADLARQLLVGSDALQTALRSLAEPAD